MTNDKTVTMSREMIERIVKDGAVSVAQLDQLQQTLEAPTEDRQDPVQWQRKSKMHGNCWYPVPADEVNSAIAAGWEIRGLYTSPPARVSVAFPARADDAGSDNNGSDVNGFWGDGWNACIDKVKELNP